MQTADRQRFKDLLTDAMAFFRRDLSEFALGVWWEACKGFDFEQVTKAITQHAMDPEQGRFAPMPADIVKQLQGTRTDRALVAWGKAFDAMSRVGAYRSVQFDDPIITAVILDMGGWPALCRTEDKELSFTQKRFCETYRAYASRGGIVDPGRLVGLHEQHNAPRGLPAGDPVQIGDRQKPKLPALALVQDDA